MFKKIKKIYMFKKIKKIHMCMLFVFLSILSFTNIYAAGVPTTLGYQGKLTDSGGNPLGGGGTVYRFKFSLWDSPTPGNGNKLWPTSNPTSLPLTVRQGNFSVDIGDTDSGYPDVLNYDFNTNSKIYLQVEVSSDDITFETLAPRTLITSSAFSQVTSSVNGIADSSFGTTTPFLNTLISALSTNVNKAVMTIKGALGQAANLFNILDSNNNSLFTVTAGGNVGIGTTTPAYKLDIAGGKIGIDGTQALYIPGGNFTGTSFIGNGGANISHTSGVDGKYNTFSGIGSGVALTTGSYNSGFGFNSLSSLTTGQYNMAIGTNSMFTNSTGSSNVGIGYNTLYDATGSYNVAIGSGASRYLAGAAGNTVVGYSALPANISGAYNTVMGYVAGQFLTSGGENLILGKFAGRYLSDNSTAVTSLNNSVYLGSTAYPSAATGISNEIVIGYSAIGNGSNSVTLGNDSITKTILKGNVGMGTSTPSSILSINDSTSATVSLAKGLSIYNSASIQPGYYTSIFSATDSINSAQSASYVVPSLGNSRLYFGRSGQNWYSLNLQYVSNIESFPATLGMQTTTVGGVAVSRITSGSGGNLELSTDNSSNSLYITSPNASTTSRRSLAFKFFGLDTDTYKRSSGFIFAAEGNSSTWTSPHTIWTAANETTRLMTLTMGGNLGIGTTNPTSSFGRNIQVTGAGSAAMTLDNGSKKYSFGVTGTGSLGFYDETLSAYRLSVNSSGNVGIGTTTPSSILTLGSGQIEVPSGSATVASYSFGGDLNTGIFRVSEDTIGFTSGGTQRLSVSPSGLSSSVPFFMSQSNPVVQLESTAANATNAGTIVFRTPGGSESYTQTFDASANVFLWKYGLTEAMRMNGNLQLGINNTSMSGMLTIQTNGALSDTIPAIVAGKAVTTGNSIGASFRNFTGTTGDTYIEISGLNSSVPRSTQLRTNSSGAFGIYTGSTAYSTLGTERLTILQDGKIGIGTTTPEFPLDVFSTTSSNQTYGYLNSSGLVGTSAGTNSYSIRAQGRVLAQEFNAVSDARLKDVQFDLNSGIALDAINKLNPISFTWKDSPTGQPVLGFLAQDVENIIPNAVSKVKGILFDDQRTLDYNQIVAVLVGAVKELSNKIAGFSQLIKTDKVETKTLCIEDVCVTKDQLRNLLQGNNIAPVVITTPVVNNDPEPVSTSTTTSDIVTEPVVDIPVVEPVITEPVVETPPVVEPVVTVSE